MRTFPFIHKEHIRLLVNKDTAAETHQMTNDRWLPAQSVFAKRPALHPRNNSLPSIAAGHSSIADGTTQPADDRTHYSQDFSVTDAIITAPITSYQDPAIFPAAPVTPAGSEPVLKPGQAVERPVTFRPLTAPPIHLMAIHHYLSASVNLDAALPVQLH